MTVITHVTGMHRQRGRRVGYGRPAGALFGLAVAVGGIAVPTAAVSASVAQAKKAPLTICEDSEVTGTSSSISTPSDYGAQAEVNHLNASGGILGHKLNLVLLDNQSQPSLSAQIAQECVSQYNAWAIVGMSSNTDLIPAIPVVVQNSVPMISWSAGWNYPASGLPTSDYESYAFPGRATSAYSDYLMLQDVVLPKHLTRVAMVQANSAGSLLSGQSVQYYLQQDGLTLTDTETIQTGQTNLTPVILKLLASNPQAIIMNTIAGTASVNFLEALRAQNATIPAGVCAGCTTSSFIASVGGPQGMANTYALGTPDELLKVLPKNKANASTFTDIHNYDKWMIKAGYTSSDVINGGAEGWNTVEMLTNTAVKANSIKASAIKNALQHEHDDTTGQLWQRTPQHYDVVNQQNAIVTINPDGSIAFVKSPKSTS